MVSECAIRFLDEHHAHQSRPSALDDVLRMWAGLGYYSYWHSFVGNVLGAQGQMAGWSYEGSFRDDLYYRLAEIVVRIPALAERPGDAALHFSRMFPRLSRPRQWHQARSASSPSRE